MGNNATIFVSFILFIFLVFFFAIALAVRYRKRKQENDELKTRIAVERMKIQIEMQEETMKHIGRELHDNLGQIASLIKINLNTILTDDKDIAKKLDATKELTRQLIGDIKKLSVRLGDDPVTRKGLAAAIEKEMKQLQATGIYSVVVDIRDDIPAVPAEKAIVIYRMLQEGINNIIKHSNAKNISLQLVAEGNDITLVLQDDGDGFDTNASMGKGAGLQNLGNRALLLNADLNISSVPGKGTSITIKMPIS